MRFVQELLIGFYSPLLHGVVDMTYVYFLSFKFYTEEGVFVSIFSDRLIEAYSMKDIAAHHETEGDEMSIGRLLAVVGCSLLVCSLFISIA